MISASLVCRLVVLAAGLASGLALVRTMGRPQDRPGLSLLLAGTGLAAGLGVLALERAARRAPVDRLFWGTAGGLAGLLGGLALGHGLEMLWPAAAGIGRGVLALFAGYLGAAVALAKRGELAGLSRRLLGDSGAEPGVGKVLDTSVIIDGRIAEVAATGFLEGMLVVPQFVLRELQQIADASDAVRRNRGKRGFDTLDRLRATPGVQVAIDGRDFPEIREVDQKLVALCRLRRARLVTNDTNLLRVAGLSDVGALSLNALASALRPAALPGEVMHVHPIREGKEPGQAVAYLDDGTMVVVEHGKRLIGQSIDVTVTSVLQTAAGRMIFARLREDEPTPR
ncbi:MAG: PIN domain-containing protein [Candidatus Rokubacteria bacterium]|nr:PIN domain-containing protein [Candidatus Rokubacteria bacterium]